MNFDILILAMTLKLWQQVNLSLLLPVCLASIIVLYAVYAIGTISKRVDFIETADDINITLLELRRYEKNIMLFSEHQNVEKFRQYMKQLDSQILAAENQIVEEMHKLSYKPLLEDIRKYREAGDGLIESAQTEHRLLASIRPLGRMIEEKTRKKELALELRRYEKNYIIYREPSAVDRVHELSKELLRLQPELKMAVKRYTDVFDLLSRSEQAKDVFIGIMRQSGRAIEKVTEEFARKKRTAIERTITLSRYMLFGSLAFLIVSSTFVARIFSVNVAGTLKTMEKSFGRLKKGDFAYGVDFHSENAPSELLSFIDSYNQTVDDLRKSRHELDRTLVDLENANRELRERQDELVEAKNLTSMRLLASEIAHEINNPLSSVSIFLGIWKDELPYDDPKRETVSLMLNEVGRCRAIIQELVDFSRKESLALRECSPASVLLDAVNVALRHHEDSNVRLAVFCGELPRRAFLDRVLIHQALVNILNNAYHFSEHGGCIEIEGYSDCMVMVIEIRDSGAGIPNENLPYIFEPFFSTRKELGGSGLGLAITKKIIERHNGSIDVRSQPGRETVFTVRLPFEGT